MGAQSLAPPPISDSPEARHRAQGAAADVGSAAADNDQSVEPLPDYGWAQMKTNPFLQGNFIPVRDEIEVSDLVIEGTLPRALTGTFLRNGPNPQFEPMTRYHVFDGDGMLHAVHIEDGKASYRNRWIETAGLRWERRQGRSCFAGMSDFRVPDDDAIEAVGIGKNPANTHIIEHAGKLYALAEAGPPHEIRRSDLSTVGPETYGGKLGPNMTAHPHVDPATGELFAFGYSLMFPSAEYYVIDAEGELFHRQTVPLRAPIMMHDFMITSEHALFLDAPAVFDPTGSRTGDFVRWKPEMGCRIGVMPRYGHAADIQWFEVSTGYIFHFFNAYTEGDTVVIDGPVMPYLQGGGGAGDGTGGVRAYPRRFELNLKTGHVSETRTFDVATEFSVIDPRRTAVKHRYGYGYGYDDEHTAILSSFRFGQRFDFETGEHSSYDFGPSCSTGELVYAADPNSDNEDDGWLISMVYDRDRNSSELYVLPVGDLASGPVARVKMPRRLPYGFHGSWVPEP